MAAPHVAGAAALYLQANPTATPAMVAGAVSLNATAGKVTDAKTGSPNKLLFTGEANSFLLSVAKAGLGTVRSTPTGIDCGSTCVADFARDEAVTLSAEAGPGFKFAGWSGDCAGTEACQLNLNANKTVLATFQDANGSTEVFPASGTWPIGWVTPSNSSAPWSIVSAPLAEGDFSLMSGAIGHSQSSAVEITDNFASGVVTFDWTVSSEANYDWLSFYIDGVRQDRISGCVTWTAACWQSRSYNLTAGTHTLRWAYEKDYSVASGQDAGWLDKVLLPGSAGPVNSAPQANAGGPYAAPAGQPLNFDGNLSSDSDGNITTYAWSFGDGATGSGPNPSHTYAAAGSYTVTLTVTDDDGASAQASTTATISAEPGSSVEIFADSFESGIWGQDSQNDWFRSTQRATQGTRSAEVDGLASNAQLISSPINLQGASAATVRFDWFIESGLDIGEYLAFDVSKDGGATWTEHARLRGNVDQENLWHNAQIDLGGLAGISTIQLRFRGQMSGSDEDANVDNVRITVNIPSGENQIPTANPGGPYNGTVNQAISFDGTASQDVDGQIAAYAWNFGDGTLGTGATTTHAYITAGTYTVTLTVTDNEGDSDSATTTATIDAAQVTPSEVFADSFENGQWGGLWSEDSQNDWFTSTQRATDGRYSAEVDGSATDAQLNSIRIDPQGASQATITFSWYIESGLDSGEYLAFDVSTDNGASWSEYSRLRGNVDVENTWHEAQIEVTGLESSNGLRLRFRARMSGSDEDANVDNVKVRVQ